MDMSNAQKQFARSLERLRDLQQDGSRVFRSHQLARADRERLVKHGFLRPIIKGWLMSAGPDTLPSDTTPWYASFWQFCARYCTERFGEQWHLSPQQSLDLHAEKATIPTQVVIYSPKAHNNLLKLPFETSLYGLKQSIAPPGDLITRDGLVMFTLEASLVRAPATYFVQSPTEAQVVLASIHDTSSLLARLLDGGHPTIAGRLAGAFRYIGRDEAADEILAAMRQAAHDVRETAPFAPSATNVSLPGPRVASPVVGRLARLWAAGREIVVREFPPPPDPPRDQESYLQALDDVYRHDAYHSLSIEGYEVTAELIADVASGEWDPDGNEDHRRHQGALAARGYFQAFRLVRETVAQVYRADDPSVIRTAHRAWYRELFAPHVVAGLLRPSLLAGYRSHPVFLRGSRHVPPRWEILDEAMPALLAQIEAEPHAAVRAVLGHWLLGYIHPFPDGNGRIARFLMNVLLATGGYPWTVIPVQQRDRYLRALEKASVAGDLGPFVRFIVDQLGRPAPIGR